MTLCFSTPNCILPLYISLAVIILFFLLPFSSLFQGHCRVKSNLILKYVSIVTSVTSVILSCDGCTDAHWFFMHTHQGAVLSVCIRHVNHGVHPSLFLVTWLIKSVKTSNWFIWLDSITLCLVCYDMPWFPDIFVNFKLWHFLWNQLLLFLKKDIQKTPPKQKKDICEVSSFLTLTWKSSISLKCSHYTLIIPPLLHVLELAEQANVSFARLYILQRAFFKNNFSIS